MRIKVLHLNKTDFERNGSWIEFPVLVSNFYKKFNEFFNTPRYNIRSYANRLLNLLIFSLHVLVMPSRKADLINAVVMTEAQWAKKRWENIHLRKEIPKSCMIVDRTENGIAIKGFEIAFHKNEYVCAKDDTNAQQKSNHG